MSLAYSWLLLLAPQKIVQHLTVGKPSVAGPRWPRPLLGEQALGVPEAWWVDAPGPARTSRQALPCVQFLSLSLLTACPETRQVLDPVS